MRKALIILTIVLLCGKAWGETVIEGRDGCWNVVGWEHIRSGATGQYVPIYRQVPCPKEVEPKCRWEWRQTTESGLTKFLNDGWKPTPLNYDEGKAMFPYLKTEYSKMIFWLKRKVCN